MLLRHSLFISSKHHVFCCFSKKIVIYIRYYCSNPSPVTHFGLLAETLSSSVTDAGNNNNKNNKISNNNTIQIIRIKSCELGGREVW